MINAHTAYHPLPETLRSTLLRAKLETTWNALTDIQRNEWACYVTNAKKAETNTKRLARTVEDLRSGIKSPCCWPGCPHRRPQAAKWFA